MHLLVIKLYQHKHKLYQYSRDGSQEIIQFMNVMVFEESLVPVLLASCSASSGISVDVHGVLGAPGHLLPLQKIRKRRGIELHRFHCYITKIS